MLFILQLRKKLERERERDRRERDRERGDGVRDGIQEHMLTGLSVYKSLPLPVLFILPPSQQHQALNTAAA